VITHTRSAYLRRDSERRLGRGDVEAASLNCERSENFDDTGDYVLASGGKGSDAPVLANNHTETVKLRVSTHSFR